MSQKLPLVKVYWKDTCTDDRWMDFKDAAREKSIACCNVGWLLRKDKKEIVLTSMRHSKRSGFYVPIPRGCVTAIRKLEK